VSGLARRLDPEARRRQILEAAIAYFAECGFAGQTRELSRRIGITQPLLYRYFPSKQDLIGAVFDAVFIEPWDTAWTVVLKDRRRALRSRLVDFYTSYAATAYRPEWIRIYLHAGLAGMELNRAYTRIVKRRLLSVICEEMRLALLPPQALAHLRRVTPRELELVWNLHGSMFYRAVRLHVYGSRVPVSFSQCAADAVDLFLAGARELYPSLLASQSRPAKRPRTKTSGAADPTS